MLFRWQGSILPKILPRLILLFILTVGVVYFNGDLFKYKIPLNPAPFTLFGITLALFLGFRNNASYERFLEGRKLWGALLNDTRSLARQAITLTGYAKESKEVKSFIRFLVAFTYALKHQLRHTDASADLKRNLPAELAQRLMQAKYIPVLLMKEMAIWVQNARNNNKIIDSIIQTAFDNNLGKLSDTIGGCERLASTPIPYTYKVILHRTVYIYCFLLPFGFVDSLGWMTPIIVVFIAYTFVGLEAIADELEDPFGLEPNDLALNSMCLMIEGTLLELAGEPLPEEPVNNGFAID
jgi:putative membrane protein